MIGEEEKIGPAGGGEGDVCEAGQLDGQGHSILSTALPRHKDSINNWFMSSLQVQG